MEGHHQHAHESTPLLGSAGTSPIQNNRYTNGADAFVGKSPHCDSSSVASTFEDEDATVLNISRITSASQGLLDSVPPPSDQAVPEDNSSKEATGYAARFINVSPARFWLIFGGIMLGYVVAFFDSTLMASSHPVITSYFHTSNSASWLSNSFLLTSTAFLPLFGRISDTFGRKPVSVLYNCLLLHYSVVCNGSEHWQSYRSASLLRSWGWWCALLGNDSFQ